MSSDLTDIIQRVQGMSIYAKVEPSLFPLIEGMLVNNTFDVNTVCDNLATVTAVPRDVLHAHMQSLFQHNPWVSRLSDQTRMSHQSLYMLLCSKIPGQRRWNALSSQFTAIFHEAFSLYVQESSARLDQCSGKRKRVCDTEDAGGAKRGTVEWAVQGLQKALQMIDVNVDVRAVCKRLT
jgi:hypothetical protein